MTMPPTDLGPDIAKIERTRGVLESVLVYIAGRAEALRVAVEAALANGATEQQLEPLRAAINLDVAKADEVAAAIVVNPYAHSRRLVFGRAAAQEVRMIDQITGRLDTTNRPPVQPIPRGKNWKRGLQLDLQRARVESSLPLRQAVNCRAPAR
jgi:hypothetical protein